MHFIKLSVSLLGGLSATVLALPANEVPNVARNPIRRACHNVEKAANVERDPLRAYPDYDKAAHVSRRDPRITYPSYEEAADDQA
ncbi:hypothetical protein F5X96DRAFT_675566 [Biscogniauxia mediterranea]|nr:hypothetical protein F5X96DRAFT_675566 [Biscogniauxia mediterranea]